MLNAIVSRTINSPFLILTVLDIKHTISIGIAEVDSTIKSYEAWIECADAALYQAKESGRNKVGMHPKPLLK